MPANDTRTLVVEDDAAINDVICEALRKEGHDCIPAFSGTEAKMLIETSARSDERKFDLVVTDLMLPGMSGEEVVALIRQASDTPVLVVSAKTSVSDKIALLRSGADDYLAKPFDLDELAARADALLRRTRPNAAISPRDDPHAAPCDKTEEASGASRSFGRWKLNEEERRFEVEGEPLKLTRTEFDILAAFMRHPRKVFTRRELYREAWGEDALAEEKAINTHISNIRSKLKKTGTDAYIETVWGIGFKLVDEPRNPTSHAIDRPQGPALQ